MYSRTPETLDAVLEGIELRLSAVIRAFRLAAGQSADQFAKQIERDAEFVAALESGRVEITIYILQTVALALDIEASELILAAERGHVPALLQSEDDSSAL